MFSHRGLVVTMIIVGLLLGLGVFGDFLQEGFVCLIADDLFVLANSVDDLVARWTMVRQRLQNNNFTLSASKTVICPKETTILGWLWKSGTLSRSAHKVSPLTTVSPPKTLLK